MKLPHRPFRAIFRLVTLLLSWGAFESIALAQSGPLEDKPYVPSASVVKGTVAALSDPSERVVALAVRVLANWRQAAVAPEIAKLLVAETPGAVRIEAFNFFARLGPQAKPHIAAILNYANDPDPNIRAALLAVVLNSEAAAENADAIRPLLGDSRAEVRVMAANCLGQAGKAADKHRKALMDALGTSGSLDFKVAALRAVARIGGLNSADIDVIAPLIRDRDAEVRIAAWAATLSGIVDAKAGGGLTAEKDKTIREALVAQFENEAPETKSAIIEEAGNYKAAVEDRIEGIAKHIRTGTTEVKASALRVLGKGGNAALTQLALVVEQAKDPDSIVRAAAISALGSLGPEAVKPNIAIIANALLDASPLVRDEALQALPAGGDALRNFPYKMRDVFPGASPEVRATLVRALPIIAHVTGMDEDMVSRGRAGLADPSEEIRVAMAFVMSQLGPKDGAALLPDLIALAKDPEPSVRGAVAVALRSFATDAEAKKKLREALRPLLKDRDAEVRWAVLDTFHELDPGQEPELVSEIAGLLKDEEQPVRGAAVRALGAAGPAAKAHLLDIIRFFYDDPAIPPYAAAQAVGQISPLKPQELTSLLYPLYVSAELLPIVRLTAYAASGGDPDGVLLVRLLGRSQSAVKDVVTTADKTRATTLLQDALKSPLLHEKLKTEINSRLAEVKATP